MLEPSFQLGCARREDRRRIRCQSASWIGEHRAPVRIVRDTVCRDQYLDIHGAQPVRECGLEHRVLIFGRQSCQRVCRRRSKAPGGQRFAGSGRQPCRQLKASGDPARFPRQQVCDVARLETVLVDQRLDDARLVCRSDRARWRVGHQHESLVVDGGQRAFHDRGHRRAPRRAPPLVPAKTVEDLVVIVVRRDNPQRDVGELRRRCARAPGTETGEACAEPIDGKPADRLVSVCPLFPFARVTSHRHPSRLAEARTSRRPRARCRSSGAGTR